MGPRINRLLKLVDSGHKVKVVGPIGTWDPGIDSATFWVVVAQVQDGKFVVATAQSEEYEPGDITWDARAPANDRLNAGPAYAWAVASFETSGGQYAWYQWEVDVVLEV